MKKIPKLLKMEKIQINGKEYLYIGSPLSAFVRDDNTWGGRSNFLASNEEVKTEISLKNLEDSFNWMKKWINEDKCQGGYVLDFSSKTIYYDSKETLDYLKQKRIPAKNWDNYFQTFIEKDFSK